MKIKTRYIILSLMIVILLVVPGMLFAVERVAVKQPITMKGVYFSKTPQSAPLKHPSELEKLPPTPAPLTPQVRNNAINQIRGAVGLKALIPLQPLQSVVPAHVVLTPDAPKSGKSFYRILSGNNYPDLSGTYMIQNKVIELYFNTIPGKTYMVDLSVNSFNTPINFSGEYYGSIIPPQNLHIIIGFTANYTLSRLTLSCGGTRGFWFHGSELTQVN